MEFWGVEVKHGQQLEVKPEHNKVFQITQVSMGEVKKSEGVGSIPVRVHVDGKSLVIGILSGHMPQMQLDLVLEKDFKLSHDWKDGSVYFFGYSTYDQEHECYSDGNCTFQDGEEAKATKSKPAASKLKSASEPHLISKKMYSSDEDSSSSDQYGSSSDDESESISYNDSSDEEEFFSDGDNEETEEDEDSSDGEGGVATATKKIKRPSPFLKTAPNPFKKARSDPPQKSDVKKASHTKQPAETPASVSKSKKEATKSSAQFSNKNRASENGSKSHKQAKRGGGK